MAFQIWQVCLLPKRSLWKSTLFALFGLCIRILYISSLLMLSNLHLLYLFTFVGSLASSLGRILGKDGIDNDPFL